MGLSRGSFLDDAEEKHLGYSPSSAPMPGA
jgi:hypothetical protein